MFEYERADFKYMTHAKFTFAGPLIFPFVRADFSPVANEDARAPSSEIIRSISRQLVLLGDESHPLDEFERARGGREGDPSREHFQELALANFSLVYHCPGLRARARAQLLVSLDFARSPRGNKREGDKTGEKTRKDRTGRARRFYFVAFPPLAAASLAALCKYNETASYCATGNGRRLFIAMLVLNGRRNVQGVARRISPAGHRFPEGAASRKCGASESRRGNRRDLFVALRSIIASCKFK